MLGKNKPEVLVIGAGPVGLFAALALAKRGVRAAVMDQDWRIGVHGYALALHPASLQLFQDLDLLEEVLGKAFLIRNIALYDAQKRLAELKVPGEGRQACLALMPQSFLESFLERTVRFLGVEVHWIHRAVQVVNEPDGVNIAADQLIMDTSGYAAAHWDWRVVNSSALKVPFVIGADGHRSTVRQQLGIPYQEVGDTVSYAVFECRTETEVDPEMRIVLGERTMDAYWPLSSHSCRWTFQVERPEALRPADNFLLTMPLGTGLYQVLDPKICHRFLAERAPWFQAKITDFTWRILVRFERRLAGEFGRDRVWLAGDAGHMTGPVGMQSVNVGLREASHLAALLADILQQKSAPDALRAYNEQRLAEWKCLQGMTDWIQPGPLADPAFRSRGSQLLSYLPGSGNDLLALAGQIGFQLV